MWAYSQLRRRCLERNTKAGSDHSVCLLLPQAHTGPSCNPLILLSGVDDTTYDSHQIQQGLPSSVGIVTNQSHIKKEQVCYLVGPMFTWVQKKSKIPEWNWKLIKVDISWPASKALLLTLIDGTGLKTPTHWGHFFSFGQRTLWNMPKRLKQGGLKNI